MVQPFQYIHFGGENGIARITLARPPLNVLDISMLREVNKALSSCQSQQGIQAIVFDAAADCRAFCSGVAIEDHAMETVYQMLEEFHKVFRTLLELAKPTIAVVDGAALGGGCELAAACDIVVASDRSRFGQPEIKLGLFPPVAAVLLPRVIGEKRARELILTGEMIDAAEALRLGLVNYVVTQTQLAAKTEEILNRLREHSATALEFARRALDHGSAADFDQALRKTESLYLNELMRTLDAQEGIAAFMQKRKPVWKHR